MIAANLVTPKASAKLELLFNKLASEAGLLNKSSHLAATLGVTKLMHCYDLSHFVVLIKPDLDVQQTNL